MDTEEADALPPAAAGEPREPLASDLQGCLDEDDTVGTSSLFDRSGNGYRGEGLSDVRLVDEAAGEVLKPLRASDRGCLCSDVKLLPIPGEQGQQALFVTFPAPAASTQQVAVQVGDFPLSRLVDLGEPGGLTFTAEPTQGDVAGAEVMRLKLFSLSTALDGASRMTKQGNTVAVDVSSDVLFAFGSAELTGKAQSTLATCIAEMRRST